jgi:hypothetical protein
MVHLVAAFAVLRDAFARSSDASLNVYAAALSDGLRSGQAAVAIGRDGVWPTGLLAGMRQGARELVYLLAMLPDSERPQAIAEVQVAGGPWLAALLNGTARRSAAIAKRGRIRSEDEFYCVRERIDQLEGTPDDTSVELRNLYALVDAYPDAAPARASTKGSG